ncbi:hypothetical protein ACH4VX_17405 [Streptomyces sp. NPDC020731]|uniref:hypothetical protein n=1 Tax=Streptomyces sp. NPDC020731 TaxID=3365085 RepID=UPI00379FAB73
MTDIRRTPPRPLDVTAFFPQLAPLARTATRLHPRPGSPSPHDSSIGGPLLWPADEPWPYCEGSHQWHRSEKPHSPDDVREWRRIGAQAKHRPVDDVGRTVFTPEEKATLERIKAGRPHPEGPIALLPLAQLYARDIPDLRPPGGDGADLLQVLWCPCDHPPDKFMPRTVLFWRRAAEVTDVLATPPQPSAVQFDEYVPEPCLLAPEQITEYPHFMELSDELRARIQDWSRWEAAGTAVDSSFMDYPSEFYEDHLSVAPGWKVGGWASWGPTDPQPRGCPACGIEMDPLLTIATFEWDDNSRGWVENEDRPRVSPSFTASDPEHQRLIDAFRAKGLDVQERGRVPRSVSEIVPEPPDLVPRQPTEVQIASGYRQQLYRCPVSAEHPHLELMQ